MTEDTGLRGQCHCGAVRFRVKLTDGFDTIRRCTCSYCRMRSALAVSVFGLAIDLRVFKF